MPEDIPGTCQSGIGCGGVKVPWLSPYDVSDVRLVENFDLSIVLSYGDIGNGEDIFWPQVMSDGGEVELKMSMP
jgi:hypothetical protein